MNRNSLMLKVSSVLLVSILLGIVVFGGPERDERISGSIEGQVEQPRARDLNTLHKLLEKEGWLVPQVHRGNETIIVVLADAHLKEVEQLNLRRLSRLEELFDLEFVSLENIVNSPSDPEDLAMRAEVEAALAAEPDKLLKLKGSEPTDIEQLSYSNMYRALFEAQEFEAFGFEVRKQFQRVIPGAIVELGIRQYLNVALLKGYSPIASRGRYSLPAWELLRASELLHGEFPEHPVFDPARLHSAGEDVIVLGPEDEECIKELLAKHDAWAWKHAVYPRNETAAERTVNRMRERGFSRGALVIGRSHLQRDSQIHGKTVQERLASTGVSFIVVDILAQ